MIVPLWISANDSIYRVVLSLNISREDHFLLSALSQSQALLVTAEGDLHLLTSKPFVPQPHRTRPLLSLRKNPWDN